MGIRKFVHFLCEAETQNHKDPKTNIMCYFVDLLYNYKLINAELKTLLEIASTKSPEKSVISNYSTIFGEPKLNPSLNNYKPIEIEQLEIKLNSLQKPKCLCGENEKFETFDKTKSFIDEINNSQGKPPLSSLDERLVSVYSGELSESMHATKISDHSEYKILINEKKESDNFRSHSYYKLDHSVSEKSKNGFSGFDAKKMQLSMVNDGSRTLNFNKAEMTFKPPLSTEKKNNAKCLIFKT